jgi:hypothetical protein
MSRKSRVDMTKPINGERWIARGREITIVGRFGGGWMVINENGKLEIEYRPNLERKVES